MIQAYTLNSLGIAYTAGSTIVFTNVKTQTECTTLENSNTIKIKKPGKYLVQFDGVIGGAESMVSVQMNNDGNAVSDAVAETYTATIAEPGSVSMTTVVQVLPSCCSVDNTAKLTFSLPTAVTLYKANVVVNRLCQ